MAIAPKPSIQQRHFSPAHRRANQLVADGYTYPIIFMTGLDDELIRRQADAAGGVAFLHKPFPARMLFDAIEKALE